MSQRVCIVTGASRGIGLAIALQFAEAGYNLVLAARSPGPLEAAARQIEEIGVACEALPVDVGTPAGAAELADVSRKRFGRVDVLVNNAGVAPLVAIESMDDETYDTCMNVNVGGVFYLTRAVWPMMRQQRDGVIVNISSVAARDPFPGFAVYGACKAWVNTFTQAVATEGREHGIRVYSIGPGATETQMLRDAFPDYPNEQIIEPHEIARVVLSVCDPVYQRVSGQTIYVPN